MTIRPAKPAREMQRIAWGEGPWLDEPDEASWTASGLVCQIMRSEPGHLCGYVGLPAGHPRHGLPLGAQSSLGMGITYAAGSAFVEEHRGLWFLGFDCMHERDFIPAFVQLAKAYNLKSVNTDVANYKTFDWVRAKVEELAAQLASEG